MIESRGPLLPAYFRRSPAQKMEDIGAQCGRIVAPIAVNFPAGSAEAVAVLATPVYYSAVARLQLLVRANMGRRRRQT